MGGCRVKPEAAWAAFLQGGSRLGGPVFTIGVAGNVGLMSGMSDCQHRKIGHSLSEWVDGTPRQWIY